MNTIDIIGFVFAIVALLAYLVVSIEICIMLVNDTLKGTSKATKFRIEALPKRPYGYMFAVQRKRWWGWQTVYSANFIGYCEDYIKDMSKVRNVEWVRD